MFIVQVLYNNIYDKDEELSFNNKQSAIDYVSANYPEFQFFESIGGEDWYETHNQQHSLVVREHKISGI